MTDTQTPTQSQADATAEADVTDLTGVEFDDADEAEIVETDELTVLRAERDEYLEQLRRALADFANFRKRTDQDRAVMRQLANRDLLMQVVDVQDDFNRALSAIPEDQRGNGWVSGTAMIEKKLQTVLERAGVSQLEALGQPFDPAVHEAVASDPGSSGEIVVEVFRTGYKLGDQVLRAAMVRTGDKPVA